MIRHSHHPPARRAADPCQLTPQDLTRLGEIHELLKLLNDPYASGQKVAQFVDAIPVLKARIVRHASHRFVNRRIESAAMALSLIGNRGLESELLSLLEDLTILKCELDAG